MTTGFQISEVSENTTSEVKIGGLTLLAGHREQSVQSYQGKHNL